MATFVSYLRTLGRVPDHGSDQRKTVINHCPFVMFVLMQVQHKGSYYLEISEPESEGFKSDEWEEDEQQIHNQGPSNCPLVININGETYRYLSHSLYSWIRAEIFLSYHIVRKTIQTNIYGQGIPIMESFIVHIVTLTQPKGSF